MSWIAFSVVLISPIPATLENCAICATICVLSTGENGSWFFSCAVISLRKSDWPSWVEPLLFAPAALVVERLMPRLVSVVSKAVAMVSVRA